MKWPKKVVDLRKHYLNYKLRCTFLYQFHLERQTPREDEQNLETACQTRVDSMVGMLRIPALHDECERLYLEKMLRIHLRAWMNPCMERFHQVDKTWLSKARLCTGLLGHLDSHEVNYYSINPWLCISDGPLYFEPEWKKLSQFEELNGTLFHISVELALLQILAQISKGLGIVLPLE